MKAAPSPSSREHLDAIRTQMGDTWLPDIYRERILKMRTRAYHFGKLPRNPRIEVHHTLLGVELQIGRRRFLCPDLATARYLSIFARVGANDVAIPYDITKLSYLADELESAWQRTFLLLEHKLTSSENKTRIRGLLIAKLRTEIAEAGAGTEVPEFKQSTKQRKT
ncbi:MAG TPA: hypothetical protein VGN86_15810 [Pyrinomonadaceae bacterium]|jgi:hypothetical protein|nr:hypothetical protein [Pyrinomonadaceae bacterium]